MSKKFTTLKDSPEYFEELIDLIEKEFGYTKEFSFKEDFLPLIDKDNWENLHLILIDNKLVAHIGAKKEVLEYKDTKTDVVFLGGIVVNKHFQGEGLFKELINQIFSLYKDASLFLLWSDKVELFNKQGFLEFGSVFQNTINSNDNSYQKVQRLDEDNIEQMRKLYQEFSKTFITVKRDEKKWQIISQMNSVEKFIEKEDDLVKGYFFKGKGLDLPGVVHEIVGNENINEQKVWSPLPLRDNHQSLYISMIRIGNLSNLSFFIEELTKRKLQLVKQEKEDLIILLNSKEYVLSPTDFFQGLWGPSYIEELEGLVPPIFIGGVDSI